MIMRRRIAVLLFVLLFASNLSAFAEEKIVKEIKKDVFLIDSEIFSFGPSTRGTDPGVGSVKIDDVMMNAVIPPEAKKTIKQILQVMS